MYRFTSTNAAHSLHGCSSAPIAHSGESDVAPQDAKGRFHPGSRPRLDPILAPHYFVQTILILGPAAGHVLGIERKFADCIALSLITSIASYRHFFAVQQVRQHIDVGGGGCRSTHEMNEALLGIQTDMRIAPELPLLPFARLVHFRIALAGRVLLRRRRDDNGRIHNRTRADTNALALQIQIHRVQYSAAQIMHPQQITKTEGCGLIRRRARHRSKPAKRRSVAGS